MGAHLANAAAAGDVRSSFYWRERNRGGRLRRARRARPLVAIEVKSGRAPDTLPGLRVFAETFKPRRTLLVGNEGVPLEEFLSRPVVDWLQS